MHVQLLPELETSSRTDELMNEALATFIEQKTAYLAAVDEGLAAAQAV